MNKKNINLYILKASGRLTKYAREIKGTFDAVLRKVCQKIPISDIDVVVYDDQYGYNIIPELGIGGHTYSPNSVFIYLDPKFPNFLDTTIREELERTLAHEFNHAARWQTVGYGTTLLEAMISEGVGRPFRYGDK